MKIIVPTRLNVEIKTSDELANITGDVFERLVLDYYKLEPGDWRKDGSVWRHEAFPHRFLILVEKDSKLPNTVKGFHNAQNIQSIAKLLDMNQLQVVLDLNKVIMEMDSENASRTPSEAPETVLQEV